MVALGCHSGLHLDFFDESYLRTVWKLDPKWRQGQGTALPDTEHRLGRRKRDKSREKGKQKGTRKKGKSKTRNERSGPERAARV